MDRRQFIQWGALTTAHLGLAPLTGKGISVLATDALELGFRTPPDSARPGGYWWWFNSLVDKEGITRDLEEFRDKGMGEVLLVVSAAGLGGRPIPSGPAFLSPEWKELYRHALDEASRLQLKVGVNLCAGWCMGGPWIKPEYAGRWILQSRLTVTGPQKFSAVLPLPGNRDGYDKMVNAPGWQQYIDLPLEQLDYRDTAVTAFPDPGAGAQLSGERLKVFPAKTNRKDASNFIRARDAMGPTLAPWPVEPQDTPVPVTQVIDLTAKMQPDGRLEWDVPEGRWTIIRTGHRMTGSRVMLALPEAEGLSIDWLDESGVDEQFKYLGNILLEAAGPHVGKTLQYFCDDSFEDGFPNWTARILEKFKLYRGYDPTPYLPVFSGKIIGSAEISDRFLYDYRKTVADCMADGHYKHFADRCHEHGMDVQNEAAGPSRSGTMCMDAMKNLGRSDRPMGEFWLGKYIDTDPGVNTDEYYGTTRLEDGQDKICKMVSSAAHIYGKRTASAESFTSTARMHWGDAPNALKPAADRAFCEGINRMLFHTTTATRPKDGKPGYEYGAGTHINPNVTWWPMAGGFIGYLGRCQHLLQTGLYVADVLYYNGDWAPNIVPPVQPDATLGKGYSYDVCNAEVLLARVSVKDGKLVLPDGMSYRLLALPDTRKMPLEVIQKLRELVQQGATIAGAPPTQDPGLKGYPQSDAAVRALAAEVWGDCDGSRVQLHTFGKGRVFWGKPLRDILSGDGITPDFTHTDPDAFIDFIHRRDGDTDIYFIANRLNRAASVTATFRVKGRQPEIWDAMDGSMRNAAAFTQAKGGTALPLEFAPHQSMFIIFRKPAARAAGRQSRNFPSLHNIQQLEGPWQVQFDPQWGGPASVQFNTLTDWKERPEENIRHYSGKAVYTARFDLEKAPARGARMFLQLGVVKNIASVKLNGKALGIVWTDPWQVEISSAIRPAGNELEITVINLWPNRLIGDAALPPEQRLTRTNMDFKKDTPLLSSGLLGPVIIQMENV